LVFTCHEGHPSLIAGGRAYTDYYPVQQLQLVRFDGGGRVIHTKIESTNAMPVLWEIALFNREHLLADGKFGHYRVWGMPLVRPPFQAGITNALAVPPRRS